MGRDFDGRIVVDAMNYWPPVDGHIAEVDDDERSTSELNAARNPRARVVKSFNHIGYHEMEDDSMDAGSPLRRAIAVVGDDADARAVIARLIDDIGFDAVDGGAARQRRARSSPGIPHSAANCRPASWRRSSPPPRTSRPDARVGPAASARLGWKPCQPRRPCARARRSASRAWCSCRPSRRSSTGAASPTSTASASSSPSCTPSCTSGSRSSRSPSSGLLFRWRGRGDGDPVVLMAHYDVVPAVEADGWSFPPFEGRIHDGSVYGRGTLDDKGPLLVLLEAVENLLADGFSPARDVYLSFGGNEESHGAAAAAIADRFRERGITPWLVLDEGGAVVDAPLPFVKVPAAMVGVGEKGVLTLRLSARGEGGHASAPPTVTPTGAHRACPAPTEPEPLPEADAALDAGHARGLRAARRWRRRLLLRLLIGLPWVTARVFSRLGGEPAALVHTTVAATMLDGGTATTCSRRARPRR